MPVPAYSLANTNRSPVFHRRFVRRCKASTDSGITASYWGFPMLRRDESTHCGEGFPHPLIGFPSRRRLERASGRCQISRVAATAYGGPRGGTALRRWGRTRIHAPGRIDPACKGARLRSCAVGRRPGRAFTIPLGTPDDAPSADSIPSTRGRIWISYLRRSHGPSAATLRPDRSPPVPADTSWQRLLPIDGS